jgi:hypothetical protein
VPHPIEHRPDNVCRACGRATSLFDREGNLVGQDHRATCRDVATETLFSTRGTIVFRLRREWSCRYTRGER